MSDIRIGSSIWRFDVNRREYTKPPNDRLWGSLIYRGHWQQVTITGENSRSWITVYGKCPKRGPHHGWALTEAEVDIDCWANDHKYKLIQHIERLDGVALKKIAEFIKWEPPCQKK